MKKSTFRRLALLCCSLVLGSSSLARADTAAYDEAIKQARGYEQRGQGAIARAYYEQARGKATTYAEMVESQLGLARHTPLRDLPAGHPDAGKNLGEGKDDGVAKIAAYKKAYDIPGATPVVQGEALLEIGRSQHDTKQFPAAITTLRQLVALPGATHAHTLRGSQVAAYSLTELKRYDEARALLTAALAWPETVGNDKFDIHRVITHTYLAQDNPRLARAELAKSVAPPPAPGAARSDDETADIHFSNGVYLSNMRHYALAREEFERIPALAGASPTKNVQALWRIGFCHFMENNNAAARGTWTKLLNMREGAEMASLVWSYIGKAYAADRNFPAAREALQKRLALPTADVKTKVEDWETIASTYLEEKNYAGAREALANLDAMLPAGASSWNKRELKLRRLFGVADTYRRENDFNALGATYLAILTEVPISRGEPTFHYEAREQAFKAADSMAEQPASMSAAFPIYEALEKLYPYDLQKAKAHLGMGNILARQDKREDAKAHYQKAYELRRNFEEGRVAQESLRHLEEIVR